jgi:uncharacterized membrane protein YeaQ/YmgE (transglycosylase-associated protein family)
MFHIIGFILFGLIVGLLARLLMPGKDRMSLPMTALLGIAGALLAGFLGRLLHWYGPGDRAGFITATLGALLVLFAYNRLVLKRGPGKRDQFRPRPA